MYTDDLYNNKIEFVKITEELNDLIYLSYYFVDNKFRIASISFEYANDVHYELLKEDYDKLLDYFKCNMDDYAIIESNLMNFVSYVTDFDKLLEELGIKFQVFYWTD